MTLSLILRKIAYVSRLDRIDWIDGHPGQPGPIFKTAVTDYVVAGLIRDIAKLPPVREYARTLHATAKELVASASNGLVADWEDGDDLCPPWPIHFGRPHYTGGGPEPDPWFEAGPQPDPWLQDNFTPAMNSMVLAYALRRLASITSSETARNAIVEVGVAIAQNASSRLFDEYCGTPVKPRHIVRSETAERAAAAKIAG